MERYAMIQFVVELNPVLRLYRPILDRQALFQLMQMKDKPGSEDREYNKIVIPTDRR